MSDYLGIRFTTGDAFPPDSPLARWATVCSMAINDLLLVNRWLVPRLQDDIEAKGYENVYLGRLAGAHLYEIATFLKGSDRINEVQEFVASLESDAQEAYRGVVALGKGATDEFAEQLKHARNQFSHYAELLPHAEDYENLKRAMKAHAEDGTMGELRDEGQALTGFRALFADDIAVELSFPDDAVDLKTYLSNVSESIALYLKFSFAAIPAYVTSLPGDVWDYIEKG